MTDTFGVPVDEREVPCIFNHDTPAMARYEIEGGCLCKDDEVQDLCAQHAMCASPRGRMTAVLVYLPVLFEEVTRRFW